VPFGCVCACVRYYLYDIVFTRVVFVQNGVIIPDSYEPNPAYRLVSPHDGIFKLFPSLHERLLQEFTRSQ
jgi:hypothetical protein